MRVCRSMYVCMYVCMCVYLFIYIYIYIYIYTHTHTHTHTHTTTEAEDCRRNTRAPPCASLGSATVVTVVTVPQCLPVCGERRGALAATDGLRFVSVYSCFCGRCFGGRSAVAPNPSQCSTSTAGFDCEGLSSSRKNKTPPAAAARAAVLDSSSSSRPCAAATVQVCVHSYGM